VRLGIVGFLAATLGVRIRVIEGNVGEAIQMDDPTEVSPVHVLHSRDSMHWRVAGLLEVEGVARRKASGREVIGFRRETDGRRHGGESWSVHEPWAGMNCLRQSHNLKLISLGLRPNLLGACEDGCGCRLVGSDVHVTKRLSIVQDDGNR
jgi:hypothetical protein